MMSLNLLSKLATRTSVPILPRGLTTGPSLLKQCGKSSRDRGGEDACRQKFASAKKRKSGKKCEPSQGRGEGSEDTTDLCNQQVALECARKIAELQKQWEAIAAAAAAASEAKSLAEGQKRRSSCPVKAPRRDEEPQGPGRIIWVLTGLALAAALLIYYWPEITKEAEEGEKDKGKDE